MNVENFMFRGFVISLKSSADTGDAGEYMQPKCKDPIKRSLQVVEFALCIIFRNLKPKHDEFDQNNL